MKGDERVAPRDGTTPVPLTPPDKFQSKNRIDKSDSVPGTTAFSSIDISIRQLEEAESPSNAPRSPAAIMLAPMASGRVRPVNNAVRGPDTRTLAVRNSTNLAIAAEIVYT